MAKRKLVTRDAADRAQCEEMHVEFVGGELDGARVILDVVREGPDEIRVLERGYTRTFRPVRSSEVVQTVKNGS